MSDLNRYGTNDTFKWLSTKNAGEAFVIVAYQWSANKLDWLYTVRYMSDGRFRRYREGMITGQAVFTGIFLGDALKGASEAELADVVETKLHGEGKPQHTEPIKRLAKVYDIMDACIRRYGMNSAQYKTREHWYAVISEVGFKKAVGAK